MKSNKPQHTTTTRTGRKTTLKKLNKYIDHEVTLIHENLEELKCFLGEHAAMKPEIDLEPATKEVDAYLDSANDLFRQIALENSQDPPLEAKFYETLVLKKRKKKGV